MSRTGWKQVEREASALLGATRHWANAGEREDPDSPHFAGQVKNPQRLSLAELERLVEEMTIRGIDAGKVPVVLVKRSAGAGRPTPMLVVLPAGAWRIVSERFMGDLEEMTAADLAALVRERVVEAHGMRRRVAAYVAKSKARGRR